MPRAANFISYGYNGRCSIREYQTYVCWVHSLFW